ncbi:Hsp33 family molecular chaperone HslO [Lentilactobacillus sp. TOM.63]|uniref:Hsp33 family molecular chaperone HslO n=1 Tax=Lentilactobacillus sp. TOM.63 TaxID=3055077 RepID=UPI0025A1A5A2|nr:Hsp33 family molecular chaperone HslO [Lentilactobacillus sp. TOM.63]MDM7515403.1 Hsp33 family molecular chaperone HslO [Lentilactobacillus sp. TOM.63]
MDDYLVKATSTDGLFRAYAVNAKQTVATAQKDHHTSAVSSVVLGRVLIATTMLATSVNKNDEAITAKINGKGMTGEIVADSDADGHVKGFMHNPQVPVTNDAGQAMTIGEAVGTDGFVEVTRTSEGEDPYTSSVTLTSGEIGDDFTYYLAQSEQVPSAVGVSVTIDQKGGIETAGGYLIQVLPGAKDEAITKIVNRINALPAISEILKTDELPESILEHIFGKGNLHFLNKMPVEFYCNCSKVKFGRDLEGLPVPQLETMLKEDKGTDVTCNFCQSKYHYNEDELATIIAAAKSRSQKSE